MALSSEAWFDANVAGWERSRCGPGDGGSLRRAYLAEA